MKFKLKYLDVITAEKIDYSYLLRDICGIEKWRWYHTLYFLKSYKSIYRETMKLRQLDVTKPITFDEYEIKRPESIDLITYAAMIELNSLLSPSVVTDREIGDLIAETITIACYSANNSEPFNSDSESYRDFKIRVENSDLVQMISLYQWINKSLEESIRVWNEEFSKVEISNPDYDQAGGARMRQFNVILTLQNTAKEFNVPYTEAWQVPYGMTQVSSLASATQAHIQHTMSQIIEDRMRREREMGYNNI